MTIPHDPASCTGDLCDLCDSYSHGYVAGKQKLAFELEDRLATEHYSYLRRRA